MIAQQYIVTICFHMTSFIFSKCWHNCVAKSLSVHLKCSGNAIRITSLKESGPREIKINIAACHSGVQGTR